jgi:hypothetical protein
VTTPRCALITRPPSVIESEAPQQPVQAPVRPAQMTLGQIRKEAALLPGCVVRRRLFWRHVLAFRPSTHP